MNYKFKLMAKIKGGYVIKDLKAGFETPMSMDWVRDAITKGYVSNGVINKETNQVNKIKEEPKKANIVNISELKNKAKKIVEEKDFETPNDLNFVQAWKVRLVRKGGKYSDGDLVNNNDKLLVEFVNKEKNKAVADYSLDTILNLQGGLNMGRAPQNMIFPIHIEKIKNWLIKVQ